MGSKPGKSDPFNRAAQWLRQRKDAKVASALHPSARSMLVRAALLSA